MATKYRTFLDLRDRIRANQPLCRAGFLRDARYARIEEPLGNMEESAKLRAACCCVAWRRVEEERLFPLCGARFHLGVGSRSATGDGDPSLTIVWRGPSPGEARSGRQRKCWRYARAWCFGIGGILSATQADHWMDFSGACVMWALEYQKSIIYAGAQG